MDKVIKQFLMSGTALTRPAVLAGLASTLAFPAFADEVTLRSDNGSINLTGEIVSIHSDYVVLRTNLGNLNISMQGMSCVGESCPAILVDMQDQFAANDQDHDDDDHDDDHEGEGEGEGEGDDDHDDDHVNDHDNDHEDEHDDDHDDHDGTEVAVADINFSVNMVAPVGIADVLIPVLAQGMAEDYQANVFAADGYGAPLPDDIGRPAFGGAHAHGSGHDGHNEDHSLDDHEPENLVDIQFLTDAGTIIERMGVVIEEGTEIAHLSRSETDIIFLDHPADLEEIELVSAGGGGNISDDGQERILAVEGLVVAVSPESPIAQIPASAIPQIFTGEITNWSEIGGPDAPINLYSFGEDNAAFHYIEEMILAPAEVEMGNRFIEVEKMRDLASQIYDDPLAIGVVPFANLRGTRPVPIQASCGLVSTPTEFTIKTEEYTMQRRFHAYNRASVSPETQAFLDFLDTEQADDLVRKAGFIDLNVDSASLQSHSDRIEALLLSTTDGYETRILRSMVGEMAGLDRLSTNFRFAFGSSRLDVRARADVQRVVQFIIDNEPSELKLVGFTDSVGSFEANEILARNRADTIRNTILSNLPAELAGQITISIHGFGELAPVACNDDTNGRRINRRVEIWHR